MRYHRYLPVPVLVGVLLWCTFAFSAFVPRDIVLMIDNSGSMKKGDPGFLTRQAVANFVDKLSDDTRVSLLIFDHRVNMAMGLSRINEATKKDLLERLGYLDFRGQFTNIPAAMERAIYELRTQGRQGVQKSILFITDGIVDTGNKAKDENSARWLQEVLAEDASEQGIKIYGIAFTKFADLELIQTLAQKTGGEYLRAFTPEDILDAFSRANQSMLTPEPEPEPEPVIPLSPASSQQQDLPTEPTQETVEDGPIYVTAEPAHKPLTKTTKAAPAATATGPEAAPPAAAPAPAPPTPPAVSPAPVKPETSNGLFFIFFILIGLIIVIAAALFVGKKKEETAAVKEKPESPGADTIAPLPKASLKDLGGVTEKPMIDITREVTKIGRISEGQEHGDRAGYLTIDHGTISRSHAVIEYNSHIFWVSDLKSANGTFLNNKRLTSKMPLKNGDVISFDTFDFEFVVEAMAQLDETIVMDMTFLREAE